MDKQQTCRINPRSNMDYTILRQGNPHYGYRMRLYSRTGYLLTILPYGNVIGLRDEDSDEYKEFQIVEFTTAGVGEVRIRGVYANMYLAMDEDGQIYGEENPREEATVFIESFYQGYNIYLSKKYEDRNWYVGIKKSGRPKPANRTRWGQKAIQFLPIRVE